MELTSSLPSLCGQGVAGAGREPNDAVEIVRDVVDSSTRLHLLARSPPIRFCVNVIASNSRVISRHRRHLRFLLRTQVGRSLE